MQLIDRKVPNDYDIYNLSDTHVGVVMHHSDAFRETIEEIRTKKNAVVTFGGDLVEGRPLSHKFFDLDSGDQELLLPVNQYKSFLKSVEPIKDKIIVIQEGNHDRGLSRQYGNMVKQICSDLNVPFGTMASIITFRDNNKASNQQFKMYLTHGAGTINSSAGDIIRREGFIQEAVKRKLKNKAADCKIQLMAHVHKLIVVEPRQRLYIVSDGNKLQQIYSKIHGNSRIISEDDRWYGCTGSFMKASIKGITTYAEAAMYDPIETGYLITEVRNREITNVRKVTV